MQEQKTDLTLADLLEWNRQQLAAANATPKHADASMANLRINVIEVAEQSLGRCQQAVDGYGPGYTVKNWMMELFGMPQMVTMRDTEGTALGTLPAIELLNAQVVEPQGE